MEADDMQMPTTRTRQEDAAQGLSQIVELDDALQQALFPHLSLRAILLLRTTCRAWRHQVDATPLYQLSQQARQSLLPPGLTSDLPLPALVKQQAQLLKQLRAQQGPGPQMQYLSFDDFSDLRWQLDDGLLHAKKPADGDDAADASGVVNDRPMRVRELCFWSLVWSPCARIEDASRWILLEPSSLCWHAHIVVDTATGRQVCFHGDGSELIMHNPGTWRTPRSYGAWLTEEQRILFHPAREFLVQRSEPSNIRLADASSRSVGRVELPGCDPQQLGRSSLVTINSHDCHAKHVLCWAAEAEESTRLEVQVTAYDLDSSQPLWQLGCPEQLFHSFLGFYSMTLLPGQQGTSLPNSTGLSVKCKGWTVEVSQILLAPSNDMLMIVWEFGLLDDEGLPGLPVPDSTLQGFSVHSAMSGEHVHSMLIPAERGSYSMYDSSPRWLPCSSNIIFTNSDGLVHLMTSSGIILWTVSRSARGSGQIIKQASHGAKQRINTHVSASPCGRWILVLDLDGDLHRRTAGYSRLCPDRYIGLVSIVEAATGSILHRNLRHQPFRHTRGCWSRSGEVCLLEMIGVVLAACPESTARFQAFQQFELLGSTSAPDDDQSETEMSLSLSPCGSIVVGVEETHSDRGTDAGLRHWQLPSASALRPADSSACEGGDMCQTLQPSICAELALRQLNFFRLAWHPLQSACIYAIADWNGGVHCINARANKCIRSWTEAELHGAAVMPELAQEDEDCCHDKSGDMKASAKVIMYHHVLAWARNGSKLAVASENRCSIVHFGNNANSSSA